MKHTLLGAVAAVALITATVGCRRDARFEVVLPDVGFDLAVVALIDANAEGSPVLAYSSLVRVSDGTTLSAERPAHGAVRLVAFLYDSLALSSALSVQLSDLPDGVEVALADDAELPLEVRPSDGDRVSERFLPTDSVTPELPATTAGSVEERVANSVADQLGMTAVAAQGYLPVAITVLGSGVGTVTSTPPGIDCPNSCSASFVEASAVVLTATPDPGSVFVGWSADCSGTATTCSVVLSNPRNVDVRFEPRGGLSEAVGFGGDAIEGVTSLDVADDGRVAVAGHFSGGEMRSGGFSAFSVDALDVWVISLTPELTHEWAAFAGGDADQVADGVAFDDAGDVYAAGTFRNAITFGLLTLNSDGLDDLYLVKLLRADGSASWGYAFGDTGNQRATNLTVPPGGPVLVLGYYAGCINLDFNNCSMSSSNGTDGFLAAYDQNGMYLGVTTGGGGPDGFVRTTAVAADVGSGRFVVTSLWDGDGGFGDDDFSLWGFDFAGANEWLIRYGGPNEDWPHDVAIDASTGNIAVGGHFAIMTNLGTGTPLTFSDRTAFVASYDDAGSARFAFGLGGTGPDETNGIVVAGNGDILLTGYFTTSIDLGCGLHLTNGGTDVFVGRLTGDGVCVWSRTFGGAMNDAAAAIALHPTGDVVIAGSFQDAMDVDGTSFVTMGGDDIFVLRLFP